MSNPCKTCGQAEGSLVHETSSPSTILPRHEYVEGGALKLTDEALRGFYVKTEQNAWSDDSKYHVPLDQYTEEDLRAYAQANHGLIGWSSAGYSYEGKTEDGKYGVLSHRYPLGD